MNISVLFTIKDKLKVFKENHPKFVPEAKKVFDKGFTEDQEIAIAVRYPDGKAEITGHDFDPCTFRFVGRFAAEIMRKNGWCLEEYMLN